MSSNNILGSVNQKEFYGINDVLDFIFASRLSVTNRGFQVSPFNKTKFTFVDPRYFEGSIVKSLLVYHDGERTFGDEELDLYMSATHDRHIDMLNELGVYGDFARLISPLGTPKPVLVHRLVKTISRADLPTLEEVTINPDFAKEHRFDIQALDQAFLLEQALAAYKGEHRDELLRELHAYHVELRSASPETPSEERIKQFIPDFTLSEFKGVDFVKAPQV